MGWGDVAENRDVLDTMLKLAPEDILHLLVYRHRYATKASVVQFIRLRHPRYASSPCLPPLTPRLETNHTPSIEDSVETFSNAILDVMEMRGVGPNWPFPCGGYPSHVGGILDHKEPEKELLRATYAADGGTGTPQEGALWWGTTGPPIDRAGRLELRS